MSNLGDSRAVLAVEEGGKLKVCFFGGLFPGGLTRWWGLPVQAIELTEDQKPEREDEKRRIHASGMQSGAMRVFVQVMIFFVT